MSWVCDVCSTDNDDESLECFVCGAPRSEASIKEGKDKKTKEKFGKVSDFLSTKAWLWIKIALAVIAIAFLIAMIVKIARGKLFIDAERNFTEMAPMVEARLDSVPESVSALNIPQKAQSHALQSASVLQSIDANGETTAFSKEFTENVVKSARLAFGWLTGAFEGNDAFLSVERFFVKIGSSIDLAPLEAFFENIPSLTDQTDPFANALSSVAEQGATLKDRVVGSVESAASGINDATEVFNGVIAAAEKSASDLGEKIAAFFK